MGIGECEDGLGYNTDTCSSLSSFRGSTFGNGVSIVLARNDWLYCEHQLLQLDVGRSLLSVPGGVFSPTFRKTGVFGLSDLFSRSRSLEVISSLARGAGSGFGVPSVLVSTKTGLTSFRTGLESAMTGFEPVGTGFASAAFCPFTFSKTGFVSGLTGFESTETGLTGFESGFPFDFPVKASQAGPRTLGGFVSMATELSLASFKFLSSTASETLLSSTLVPFVASPASASSSFDAFSSFPFLGSDVPLFVWPTKALP